LKLIEKGLQARLRSGLLLTGQLFIDLILSTDTPAQPVRYAGGHPVIPTLPGTGEQIIASVSDFLKRVETLPIEQIGSDLTASLQRLRQLIESEDLAASLTMMHQSLEQINRFSASLNQDTAPQLQTLLSELNKVLGQTQDTMTSAQYFLGADAPLTYELKLMIQDLSRAGRAVSGLADYLERHPESLIFGKGAPPQ
jgi:paraquat-inducible protein B